MPELNTFLFRPETFFGRYYRQGETTSGLWDCTIETNLLLLWNSSIIIALGLVNAITSATVKFFNDINVLGYDFEISCMCLRSRHTVIRKNIFHFLARMLLVIPKMISYIFANGSFFPLAASFQRITMFHFRICWGWLLRCN